MYGSFHEYWTEHAAEWINSHSTTCKPYTFFIVTSRFRVLQGLWTNMCTKILKNILFESKRNRIIPSCDFTNGSTWNHEEITAVNWWGCISLLLQGSYYTFHTFSTLWHIFPCMNLRIMNVMTRFLKLYCLYVNISWKLDLQLDHRGRLPHLRNQWSKVSRKRVTSSIKHSWTIKFAENMAVWLSTPSILAEMEPLPEKW